MPVVDASVVVDLIAPDVGPDSPARALFAGWARSGAELLAPGLLWLETANALLTGIRRGRWSGADADSAAVLLRRLPLRRVAEDHAHAFELARRYENWPVYDMVYVAIAERAGTEFVTADARLRARLAHLGWVKLPAEITPVTARPPRNIHEAPDPGIALCIQSPINCTCAKRSIFRANYRRGRR